MCIRDRNNREVFAMFFPPDPSVATKVAFMSDELGLETTEKYDQLVLAFAVGRREFGMGAFDPVSYTHLAKRRRARKTAYWTK